MRRTAKYIVTEILATNQQARNDDKELILQAWRMQGLILSPYQEQQFKRCLTTETIRRKRQEVQAEGKYLPDEKTKRKRERKQAQMHNYYSKKSKGEKSRKVVDSIDTRPGFVIPIFE